MDGGEARSQRARAVEHAGRREPVGGEARLVLGRLLGNVRVQRRSRSPAHSATVARRGRVDGAHAVDRRADACAGLAPRAVDALGPSLGVAVGEALLDRLERLAEAAVQVAGVEQRDADPGLARRPRSRPPISFGSS